MRVAWGWDGRGDWLQRTMRDFRVMEMFHIWFLVMVTELHPIAKAEQTVPLERGNSLYTSYTSIRVEMSSAFGLEIHPSSLALTYGDTPSSSYRQRSACSFPPPVFLGAPVFRLPKRGHYSTLQKREEENINHCKPLWKHGIVLHK